MKISFPSTSPHPAFNCVVIQVYIIIDLHLINIHGNKFSSNYLPCRHCPFTYRPPAIHSVLLGFPEFVAAMPVPNFIDHLASDVCSTQHAVTHSKTLPHTTHLLTGWWCIRNACWLNPLFYFYPYTVCNDECCNWIEYSVKRHRLFPQEYDYSRSLTTITAVNIGDLPGCLASLVLFPNQRWQMPGASLFIYPTCISHVFYSPSLSLQLRS